MEYAWKEKVREWTSPFFDEATRKQVQYLIEHDPEELTECFYKDLEFGTGGMRGIMGPGTNRINKYTIGKATAGLANYLQTQINGSISVAIAFDSRNKSDYFGKIAADVLSAKGIKVYLFEALRPTPELSYAVRTLGCNAGIVITASHNPKEYNGYKVYWGDGGQLVPPHDKGVMDEVAKIQRFDQVNFDGKPTSIERIGEEMDRLYKDEILALLHTEEERDMDIGVVFTALHGTGIVHIPDLLREAGFTNVHLEPRQSIPDGNFPTVESPNPEERSALASAIELAKEENADLVLGTDPDADRVGIGVRNPKGEFELFNGNQAGSLLVKYLLERSSRQELDQGFVCKTIVTTGLIDQIAEDYGVECIQTLTGFKYIAREIRNREGIKRFIGGGEESFGYLAGDFVRDKDAVISAVLFVQIAAIAKAKGQSLIDYLNNIYEVHGLYRERLNAQTLKGKSGLEKIADMMHTFRTNPPRTLAGEKVIEISDYKEGTRLDPITGEATTIDFDRSNVLQFLTEKGSLVTVRPSGTEPKIKFYFSVNTSIKDSLIASIDRLEQRIDQLEQAMIPK
jgi:phosphoglucomutase